jgi:uncharacterized protein HemX
MTKYITPILIILCLILGYLVYSEYKKKDNREHELNRTLTKFQDSLSRTAEQRDSLFYVIDSLVTNSQDLTTKLVQKDREIRSIKGKYNHLKQDTLGKLMDERAWKAKEN